MLEKKKDIKNGKQKNRKQKKSAFEKIPPSYEAFQQHVKPAHLQSLIIFNQADKAVIEKKNVIILNRNLMKRIVLRLLQTIL